MHLRNLTNYQMELRINTLRWTKSRKPSLWSNTLTIPNKQLGDDAQQYYERSIDTGCDTDDPVGAGPHN